MADNFTVRKLINRGWYSNLIQAQSIIVNNPALDPDGSLTDEVNAELSAYNFTDERQCNSILRIDAIFNIDGYKMERKIDKPQSRCAGWVQWGGEYPNFFEYLKHLYPPMEDIKITLNEFNYDAARKFVSERLAKNIERDIGASAVSNREVKMLSNDVSELREKLERLEGTVSKSNREVIDSIKEILKRLDGGNK